MSNHLKAVLIFAPSTMKMLSSKGFARFLLLFIGVTLPVYASDQSDEELLKLTLKVEFYVDITPGITAISSMIASWNQISNLTTEISEDVEDSDTKKSLRRVGKEISYLAEVINGLKPILKNTKLNDVSFGELRHILQSKEVLDSTEYMFAVGNRLSELSGQINGSLISQKGKNDLNAATNKALEAISLMKKFFQDFFDTVESHTANFANNGTLNPIGLSCQIKTTGGGADLIPRDTEVVRDIMKDASDRYKTIISGFQSLQSKIN